MQALYSFYTTEGLSKEEVLSYYDDTIKSSYNLLYYQLYLMVKIAEHSKDDVIKRQAKLLPSEFDKAFTAKFYENPLTQTIAANKELQKKLASMGTYPVRYVNPVRIVKNNISKKKAQAVNLGLIPSINITPNTISKTIVDMENTFT